MTALLAALFFVTALLYAAVGFGGGSTYNALLVLHGADYRILPSIALICNIIVVSGGVWRFWRAGHLPVNRLLPWMAASVPGAWIGGRLSISETVFVGVLGFSLLVAGLRLAFETRLKIIKSQPRKAPMILNFAVGGSIGFVSGLAGIGGGIFLAPVLYFLRWGNPRAIAGACSLFILVNSLSGLAGQVMKLSELSLVTGLGDYWALFPAVLIGGQIGSRLGSVGLQANIIKGLTAVLILYVAARLLLRWSALAF